MCVESLRPRRESGAPEEGAGRIEGWRFAEVAGGHAESPRSVSGPPRISGPWTMVDRFISRFSHEVFCLLERSKP